MFGRYSCVVLAGMRSMDERRRNLAAFKEGDVRFLVCTDVAAPETGFSCAACPAGYSGDGVSCQESDYREWRTCGGTNLPLIRIPVRQLAGHTDWPATS